MLTALRVVLVLLSFVAGYMCFRTGDLGAKAVWEATSGRPLRARRKRLSPDDVPGQAIVMWAGSIAVSDR